LDDFFLTLVTWRAAFIAQHQDPAALAALWAHELTELAELAELADEQSGMMARVGSSTQRSSKRWRK